MAPSTVVGTAYMTFFGGLSAWGLYGLYFGLFNVSMYILCFRSTHRRRNIFLITATIAIFLFSTIDIIIESNSLLIGFFDTTTALQRDQHFAGGGDWTYAFQDAAQLTNMLVADVVLLYRVWAVWGRRRSIIAFNTLLWLATLGKSSSRTSRSFADYLLACSIRVIQLEAYVVESVTHAAALYVLNNWAIATQALTFSQNVIATCLIALRLWALDHRATTMQRGKLMPIVLIVVESGAIYTSLLLANIVVSSLLNWAVLFVTQLISPIIGITFSLITVRVGLGLASEGTPAASAGESMSSGFVDVTFGDPTDNTERGRPRDDAASADEEGISPETRQNSEKSWKAQ
ncbi:hypothetical protein DACRYDRAFT_118648 [Dacryopinax primogenitus]|uniref:Uncharacterized protein n=1 Tax=Dacryopinax primogenitus (strain DJM 731) TaxID=1858805 RepID=M5G3L6_DACPD|nr:uncharacterized protein DACRYDRAFT_118648 [Dacryopinax primogenitus]EJT98352.1 hypothetical protein DACRYDRAFT_118648 [Dacryopinax primogenitus]